MNHTNAQGVWQLLIAYDRNTKDFAVTVIDEGKTAMVVGHAPHYLAAEQLFNDWLKRGDDAYNGIRTQE